VAEMTRIKLKLPLWVCLVFESMNITSGHYAIQKWLVEDGYASEDMPRKAIRKLWSWDNEDTKTHIWLRTWDTDKPRAAPQTPSVETVEPNND
jgi:hypothetical protein